MCGHPEDAHVVWHADETFDGWAHCTIGTGEHSPARAGASGRDCRTSPTTRRSRIVPETDDRPSRHDWRYVVRTFGKVLIAIGLLLGGFVAYQLWGTGIEARRAQNELEDEFDSLLAGDVDDLGSHDDVDRGTVRRRAHHSTPCPTRCRPPHRHVPAPTTVPIAEGDPVARLEIPEIGLDVVVVAGVSVDDLRRGPGHYPDTPLPGQYGNAAIAGHRTTYDGPFQHIDDLDPGDEIVVTTLAGRFVYEVTGTEIVEPDRHRRGRDHQPRHRRVDVDVVPPEVVDTPTDHRPQRCSSPTSRHPSRTPRVRRRPPRPPRRPSRRRRRSRHVTSTATTTSADHDDARSRLPCPTTRPDDPGTGRRRLLRRLVPRPLGDPPGRAVGVGRVGHRHRRPRAAPARRPPAGRHRRRHRPVPDRAVLLLPERQPPPPPEPVTMSYAHDHALPDPVRARRAQIAQVDVARQPDRLSRCSRWRSRCS